MGLADFFRPKWKHSDSEVRADAVRTMGDDDKQLLVQIAKNDSDESVRRIAIRKINSADALAELADGHLDGSLRDLALERASSMWMNIAVGEGEDAQEGLDKLDDDAALAEVVKRGQRAEIRAAALERIRDPRALADIARQARDEETRLAAVNAIDDEQILKSLALSGDHREVSVIALDGVEEVESLRAIAKQGKIKSVRSRAEKKIKKIKKPKKRKKNEGPTEDELKRHRRARLIKICQELEALTPAVDDPAIDTQLGELRNEFAEVEKEFPEEAEKIRERFQQALSSFDEEREVAKKRLAAMVEERAELEADAKRREELCERAKKLTDEDTLDVAEALRQEWKELGDLLEGHSVNWVRRFDSALEKHERRRTAWEDRRDARGDFEQLVEDARKAVEIEPISKARKELGAVRRRWRGMAKKYGVDSDLDVQFREVTQVFDERDAAAKSAQEEKQKANYERIVALIEKVEALDGTESLSVTETSVRTAQKALRKPGALPSKQVFIELKERFQSAESVAQERVRELREADEWGRLFNVPKQEELCKKAEALAEIEDLKTVVKELRAIQREWKKVSKATRGKGDELWARFKTACDAAYERCEGHFANMKEERAENLKQKEAICVEAEAIADSTDWKETAEKLKQLQRDWKKIGPVDRKDSDAVWKRFRAACDSFFNRRKEHYSQLDAEREENLKIKTGLCEKAEELAESSEWHETAEALKDLQAEWKGIGPVPRKSSDAIWKRFRAACDRFFDRREAHLDGGRQANLGRKKEIIAELNKLADEDAPENADEIVLELWNEWGGVGSIPFDEVTRIEAEFRLAVGRIVNTFSEELKGSELDAETIESRKNKVLQQLQALVPNKKESEEPAEKEEEPTIAEKLQEAMARNTFKQETQVSEQQKLEENAAALLRTWRRIPPLAKEREKELDSAFAETYERVVGRPIPKEEERRPARGKGRSRRGEGGTKKPTQKNEDDSATQSAPESSKTIEDRAEPRTEPAPEDAVQVDSATESVETPPESAQNSSADQNSADEGSLSSEESEESPSEDAAPETAGEAQSEELPKTEEPSALAAEVDDDKGHEDVEPALPKENKDSKPSEDWDPLSSDLESDDWEPISMTPSNPPPPATDTPPQDDPETKS